MIKAQPIAWAGFGLGLTPTLGLFAVGVYIRQFKNQPRIAQLAIANSLFLGFMGITTLLIYLRFPISELVYDQWLMQADAAIGYSWPNIIKTVAANPDYGYVLRFVYLSSLPQLFIMVAYLALTGRAETLNQALLAGTLSLLLTTLIWWIAPSVGPSAFHSLPAGLESQIGLVTNSNYAEILRSLAHQGLEVIRPSDIVGTIAFPSYHTVMSLLVVWYLRGTPLIIPALMLNIMMIPAILSHGGHHLVDLAGGMLVFAVAAWFATRSWMHHAKG
ncbi:phosphatase PAP2 family protein [Ruegeria arenilitoris]|nr:phosphatase PAP2 family protein [Ruegeria arenilitoris]